MGVISVGRTGAPVVAWRDVYDNDFTADTAADFTGAPSGTYDDAQGVTWSWLSNAITATTWGVTANGIEWAGNVAAEVYMRAAIADLVAAGGGDAWSLEDDLWVLVQYTGVAMAKLGTIHTRHEYEDDFRPRCEMQDHHTGATRLRRHLVEEHNGSAVVSTGTSMSVASYWAHYRVSAGTQQPRYSASMPVTPLSGAIWDAATGPERQPKVDHTAPTIGAEHYLKIGGYSYSGAGAVTWQVPRVIVRRRAAVFT